MNEAERMQSLLDENERLQEITEDLSGVVQDRNNLIAEKTARIEKLEAVADAARISYRTGMVGELYAPLAALGSNK